MPRPIKWLPLEDIKGLPTLINEGYTQRDIVEYYQKKGFDTSLSSVNRKIKELQD